MAFDTAIQKNRKEKRWEVYSRAHYTTTDATGTRQVFCDTTYGKNLMSSGTDYVVLSTLPREAWVLEGTHLSFDLAKKQVIALAGTLGLDNVKLDRLVDLNTVLYPIS
jgi:hypothetical protein